MTHYVIKFCDGTYLRDIRPVNIVEFTVCVEHAKKFAKSKDAKEAAYQANTSNISLRAQIYEFIPARVEEYCEKKDIINQLEKVKKAFHAGTVPYETVCDAILYIEEKV